MADDREKHNGESRISYRGRKRLRYVLYEAAISLIGKNAGFRTIHDHHRTRKVDPLKKMQSPFPRYGENAGILQQYAFYYIQKHKAEMG